MTIFISAFEPHSDLLSSTAISLFLARRQKFTSHIDHPPYRLQFELFKFLPRVTATYLGLTNKASLAMLKRALPHRFPISFVSPVLTVHSRKDTLPLRLASWMELRILFDDDDDRPWCLSAQHKDLSSCSTNWWRS
jgi:hypothetical protein